ncbi:MAG: hypothetical protein L6Q81_06165 [Bacteroidia bacterium]|nr:hypothetical protein [Bacteroidia bacterium]
MNRVILSEELLNDLYSAILDYENKISTTEKNDPIDPVELSGIEDKEGEGKVLCSTEFTQLEFKTLGFMDKWFDLIGDPAPGFTAMVFGKPKMGKSYLCVDVAGYLARNFGKVL